MTQTIEPQPILRVLVVEDDALMSALLGETLEGMGHEVCGYAGTEAAAVSAAAATSPGLMIVDSGLGEGSGITAVDYIPLIGHVPHFFVSANIALVRARKPKAVVLQKPYRVAELVQAIDVTLHFSG